MDPNLRPSTERALHDPMRRRELVEAIVEPAAAADLAAESLRRLNHLLFQLKTVSEVYAVVASLTSGLQRVPQALDMLTQYVARERAAGRLQRSGGGDVGEVEAAVRSATGTASGWVGAAADELRAAHGALSDCIDRSGG